MVADRAAGAVEGWACGCRSFVAPSATSLYAGWWWLVIALGFLLGWLATMMLPRTVVALGRAARHRAHRARALTGIPVTVTGIERLPRGNAVILFNHTSYMDAVIVAAVLPGDAGLRRQEGIREPALRRHAAAPARRRVRRALRCSPPALRTPKASTRLAKAGRLFVFFPEGTFTRRAGLSGFYLGAFKVAAEADLPVVPGMLRGMRTLLRGDQWFPRRTAISVVIEEPIMPAGTDFAAMRAAARCGARRDAGGCGEPDLGELIKPVRPPREADRCGMTGP